MSLRIQPKPGDFKLPVRPETKAKYVQFADETKLSLSAVAELAIDLLNKKSKPRRRSPAA